jgi:5,6-dimethylbenzimidazole synthase
MTEADTSTATVGLGDRARYDAFMDVVANRITTRAFEPDYVVPREHFELIVDAARHGPSGANAQPWHYIVVTKPEVKLQISEYFVAEQARRARLGMKFPTPTITAWPPRPG